MSIKYRFHVLLVLATAALSSCSRANYAFINSAPAYLPSTASLPPAPTAASPAAGLTASAAEVLPTENDGAPAHQAATALAQSAPMPPLAATPVPTASARLTALPQGKLDHAARKVLRQELRRQLAAAPREQTASGKSQLVALLLLIFLGGLGIHRFYLGYTGMGILYIALLLTSFLIVPAIALFVLLVIDLIRTITGSLKPKNGEYAKTL